jgi:hypothetical protein
MPRLLERASDARSVSRHITSQTDIGIGESDHASISSAATRFVRHRQRRVPASVEARVPNRKEIAKTLPARVFL